MPTNPYSLLTPQNLRESYFSGPEGEQRRFDLWAQGRDVNAVDPWSVGRALVDTPEERALAAQIPGGSTEEQTRSWLLAITNPQYQQLAESKDPMDQWFFQNPDAFGEYTTRWAGEENAQAGDYRYSPAEFASARGFGDPALGQRFLHQQSAGEQGKRSKANQRDTLGQVATIAALAAPAAAGVAGWGGFGTQTGWLGAEGGALGDIGAGAMGSGAGAGFPSGMGTAIDYGAGSGSGAGMGLEGTAAGGFDGATATTAAGTSPSTVAAYGPTTQAVSPWNTGVLAGGAGAAGGGLGTGAGIGSVASGLGSIGGGGAGGGMGFLETAGNWAANPSNWGTMLNVGGNLLSGYMGSKTASDASKTQAQAAQDAASAQLQATREALALQKAIYEQNRADIAPWRTAGANALGDLTGRLPDLTRQFTMADYQADPGYQFRLSQGMEALQNSAAGRGMLGSGNTLKGITDYAQGAASGEYQNAYNRWAADQANAYNRLAGVAGTGQAATNQLANLGQNYGASAGNMLNSLGTTQGNALLGAAGAQAAGQIAGTNAWTNALGNIGGGLMTQQVLNAAGNRYNPAGATSYFGQSNNGGFGTAMPSSWTFDSGGYW